MTVNGYYCLVSQDSHSALDKRNNQTASTVRRIDATLAMLSFFALKISE
jgi:hypothetical protein